MNKPVYLGSSILEISKTVLFLLMDDGNSDKTKT